MELSITHRDKIYLTGFMGTGKTTVGKLLSQKLNYRFIDTDDLIEKETGMTKKKSLIFIAKNLLGSRKKKFYTLHLI